MAVDTLVFVSKRLSAAAAALLCLAVAQFAAAACAVQAAPPREVRVAIGPRLAVKPLRPVASAEALRLKRRHG